MTDNNHNEQNDAAVAASVSEVMPEARKRLYRAAIEVKLSPVHGYGVFADDLLLPGEIIEECPVVLVNEEAPSLKNLRFCWKPEGNRVLALGYGSIYNHAAQPNATYSVDSKNGLLIFTAIKQIYRGEEIFINYGSAWFAKRKLDPVSFQPLKGKIASNAHRRLVRITAIGLLLVAAFILAPKVAKSQLPTLPNLTTLLQKLSLVH